MDLEPHTARCGASRDIPNTLADFMSMLDTQMSRHTDFWSGSEASPDTVSSVVRDPGRLGVHPEARFPNTEMSVSPFAGRDTAVHTRRGPVS